MSKNKSVWASAIVLLSLSLAGCSETMSGGQKGALTGAALGSGIGMVAGGSFGEVVGAGLIGGSLGYIVGDKK
ncbi:MAG: hypothetical protein KIT25_14985 [Enhydrobacter sp.]|nr:MAG: hypothetical protein KIT25_14985 [Enhydrobacter sp.]